MRKIVASTFITLDGVMENPHLWSSQFFDEDYNKFNTELLFASDTLLLGRETYVGFAAVWPTRSDPFSDRINAMPKYVVSKTLDTLAWNNSTQIKANVVEEVTKLKQQPGENILIYGCGDLALLLAQNGVLDELHFWIHPVVRGDGQRIFNGSNDVPALKHLSTQTLGSGIVIGIYQPVPKA
jgi:dihydrofolate reductase